MVKKHIIVGLSGGVDSSVTALLLKKAGHHVEGIFMKNWEEDDTENYCPAYEDMKDAEAVADRLNIPFSCVNFAAEYWERVFSDFLKEYRAGRTPNPDILCNKEIKFRAFLDYAKQQGADAIATGHYARILCSDKTFRLLKGLDADKDQSYFLYALTEEQLAESLFPLGELKKTVVRAIAKEAGFLNYAKKDSTGICFIGERRFKTFLNDYLPAQPGNIETIDGKVIGKHEGLMFYTLGQRQGLQIGGVKNALEAPWYTAHKDLARNVLIVAQGKNHPALFKDSLLLQSIHWIHPEAITYPYSLKAKIRYRQADQPCTIHALSNGQYRVTFTEPQRAVTPGQSIVFYDQDVCLGGGIIVN